MVSPTSRPDIASGRTRATPERDLIEAGHQPEAREYNAEAVRAMAVRLWAQHLTKETRS